MAGTTRQLLTFDCLLNGIDGVATASGVLLFVTTNCIEKLDPAPKHRPGRIDRVIELTKLSEEGRRKIATRILRSWPELQAAAVLAGDAETLAAFQERCTQIALRQWEQDNGVSNDASPIDSPATLATERGSDREGGPRDNPAVAGAYTQSGESPRTGTPTGEISRRLTQPDHSAADSVSAAASAG